MNLTVIIICFAKVAKKTHVAKLCYLFFGIMPRFFPSADILCFNPCGDLPSRAVGLLLFLAHLCDLYYLVCTLFRLSPYFIEVADL